MSVWIDAKKETPPLNEPVLILFKDKEDELKPENLFYAVAKRCICNPFNIADGGVETWSTYTEYQGYYEVVFWARLYDKPSIKQEVMSNADSN